MLRTAGNKDVSRAADETVGEPDQRSPLAAVTSQERETTELRNLSGPAQSSASTTAGAVEDVGSSRQRPAGATTAVKKWTQRLDFTVKVPVAAARDHLANERTFLGWLRTSTTLAMTGLAIAQLFRLQHSASPDPVFGFYKIGTPLSGSFIALALVTILLGASRFFRQQYAMNRGRCHGASWEIFTMASLITLIILGVLVLVVAVDIRKQDI